jgi:hypothetical protein
MLSGNSLRLLKISVVVMGVLIVAGTVVMAVAIANRVSGPGQASFPARLVEPEGSRIAGIAAADGTLAVHVTGGGQPDRVRFVRLRGATGVELVPR